MPTYELICDVCGNRFDRFLTRLLRQEDRVCPKCGSNRVRSGVGGGFLGSGTMPSKSTTSAGCASSGFS